MFAQQTEKNLFTYLPIHLFTSKKVAFTLAEVLITLGIIGVVSAMTLPTLVKNHQRQVYVTQLHKFYNQMSQAIELYINDQRAVNLSETRVKNNATELKRFFNTYFKVIKDCDGTYAPCFASTYDNIDGSTTIDLNTHKCAITIVIADGTAICADSQPQEATEDENGNQIVNGYKYEQGIIAVEIDINGQQGPNIYGRDMFSLQFDSNGNFSDINKDLHENGVDTSQLFGFVSRIIDDGWKMEY